MIDRRTNRPVQAWAAYAALRENPHWKRVPGFEIANNLLTYPMPNHPVAGLMVAFDWSCHQAAGFWLRTFNISPIQLHPCRRAAEWAALCEG